MTAKIFLRPNVVIVLLMTAIIAMLIIPLPTWLIDTMIALNMVVAGLVFVSSFHLHNMTSFSSFPSVLLVTAVFRLSLTITTSRMILMEADAGKIVQSFGNFVVGGDLLIGFTVFAIVTVVQFMVITKGAERVAEVCARFSLEGLPGKQMSIDADVRANIINGEEAGKRRAALEQESQMYGALDGAMKFVKGDAVASLLIIFVNFLGGMAMGVWRHGLPLNEALETYTLLTVGDGLVAQIPALLISVASGFIVTRVGRSSESLATTMLRQLGANDGSLLAAAGLAVGAGLLPGFPLPIFSLLAAALLMIYVNRVGGLAGLRHRWVHGFQPTEEKLSDEPKKAGASSPNRRTDTARLMPETVGLALLLPQNTTTWVSTHDVSHTLNREVFLRLGVKLPNIQLRHSERVQNNCITVLVNEVHAEDIRIAFEHVKVVTGGDTLMSMEIPMINLSQNSDTSLWIEPARAENLRKIGELSTRSDIDEVIERFCAICSRHVPELFGIQETKDLLDQLETKYPELVKETLRNVPLQRISNVLQRLLSENISIRNFKTVVEAIAQWGPRERDNILLTEHVRGMLGRYITEKFSRNRLIKAIVLSPENEENIRRSVEQTSTGSFLDMNPADVQEFLDKLSGCLSGLYMALDDLVILGSADVRRFVKHIISADYPQLKVMSYSEITDQSRLRVVHTL